MDLLGLKKEDIVIGTIEKTKKSVENCNFSDLKEKEIIAFLDKAKQGVLKEETFYEKRRRSEEKERKVKKVLSTSFILIIMLFFGALVGKEYFGVLSWAPELAGKFLAAIIIIMMLVSACYEGEIN